MTARRLLLLSALAAAAVRAADAAPQEAVAMADAIRLAVANHPAMAARRHAADAETAEARLAAAWPEPSLGIESEWLGVDGETETKALLTQPLPFGHAARRRAGRAAAGEAAAALDLAALDVARDAAEAFVDVLAAEAAVEDARAALALARRAHADGAGRAGAGDLAVAAVATARAEAARREAEAARAAGAVAARRGALARLCGDPRMAASPLAQPAVAPTAEGEEPPSAAHPALRRWEAAVARHRAQLAATRAGSWRPELGIGVVHAHESGDTGVILALELPLPLSGRASGEIALAQARLRESEAMRAAELQALTTALTTARALRRSLGEALARLTAEALPAAQAARDALATASAAGAVPRAELIAAERELLQLRREAAELRAEWWRAGIAVAHAEGGLAPR